MRKLLPMVVALAVLAVPVALGGKAAPPDNAAHQCKAQLNSMGGKDFRSLWGTNKKGRNAFGKCVALTAQQAQQNVQSAEEQCRGAQARDAAAFAARYGTGKHARNAFGKCVSQTASAASRAQQTATLNAAKACKAERARGRAAFRARYAAMHKRNAFAACVAAKKKTL